MRRTLLTLMLVCGFCLPLATLSTVRAEDEAAGPVVFTVHAATCPITDVNNPDVGLFEACHGNHLGGVALTFASLETAPVSFSTDAAGVGSVDILAGISAVTQVTLAAEPPVSPGLGGYVYCADQIDGLVLFDGHVTDGALVPLFTVDRNQEIVCDWYVYTDESSTLEVPKG